MNVIDLSDGQDAEDLIDGLFAARREDRRDLAERVIELLHHEEPVVREEAISLLLTAWRMTGLRATALTMLESDADFGVRARAAIGLASISQAGTRDQDLGTLRSKLLDETEVQSVRRACLEALCLVLGRDLPPVDQPLNLTESAVRDLLDWSE